jgi:hypothetical protein
MKTFAQFITEGRDAPLYHATGFKCIKDILVNDILIPARDGTRYAEDAHEFYTKNTLSLTRSLPFALQWAPIVLELNQSKLAQTHAIRPYNFWNANHPGSRRISSYGSKPLIYPKQSRELADEKWGNQYEEMIVSLIKPISKYLVKVIVGDWEHMLSNKDDEKDSWRSWKIDAYDTLSKHLLLYDYKTKRFINK